MLFKLRSKNKYGNKKVEYDGFKFDSARERDRYLMLKKAADEGKITELKLQPKFELVPAIKRQEIKHLKTRDKIVLKTVQLPITYTADFSYYKGDEYVVEDVKISQKMLPKEFRLKVKLMRYFHAIAVRCVYKASEEI
jgi:hypothetical protein